MLGTLVALTACTITSVNRPDDPKYGSPEDRRKPDSAPTSFDKPFSKGMPREPAPRVEKKSRLGNPPYYEVDGTIYHVLDSGNGYIDVGVASWYGKKFHGRRTSSGEIYDMYQYTAAHKTLPLPSYARVTNIDNGESVVVKINDRGPFVKNRLIDLSYAAANKLGYDKRGTARVEVQVLASPLGDGSGVSYERGELQIPQMKEQSSNPKLYVQVGAFSDAMRADTLAARLREYFLQPINVSPVQVNGQTLNRVRIGPIDDPNAAEKILQQLSQYSFGSPKVVTE
ncbi:MAG: septal ring lytic transglycosylase RlpA family protein [Kangiellaceae bacterium]|nr:septal ring lytic transglycosylase RlpA family protein [Kangiellaceae bacterium]